MKRSPKRLAASFVITVAAVPTAGMALALEGCRKTPAPEPPPKPEKASSSIFRNGDRCFQSVPQHCPPGASCNPPPPAQVDCPASHRDAGEADPHPARPPGKESWVRVRPRLWASRSGCGYAAEQFCAPPGTPYECTPPYQSGVAVKCSAVPAADGGIDPRGAFALEPFVYKDGLDVCHEVPAFSCREPECEASMPPDKVVPCP